MGNETFGDRVTRLCQERGVSAYRVQKESGVKVQTIDRSKTVSLSAARKIARALGLSLADLDAPIILTIGTGQAVRLGLIDE
jgi:hypothetical protein